MPGTNLATSFIIALVPYRECEREREWGEGGGEREGGRERKRERGMSGSVSGQVNESKLLYAGNLCD